MDRGARLLLLLHAGATLFMTGVIWFVQVVHYPLFALVGSETFAAYERANIARTASVAGPVMILEALTGVIILLRRPAAVRKGEAWLGAVLLAIIWGSTAFSQFPAHLSLVRGFDAGLLHQLACANWVRVLGWSARTVLLLRVGLRGWG